MSYDRTKTKKERISAVDQVGITKEIDNLGRICIPKEMRKLFKIESAVALVVTKDGILIKNPEYVLIRKEEIKNLDR